jgi:hypothetical protein
VVHEDLQLGECSLRLVRCARRVPVPQRRDRYADCWIPL